MTENHPHTSPKSRDVYQTDNQAQIPQPLQVQLTVKIERPNNAPVVLCATNSDTGEEYARSNIFSQTAQFMVRKGSPIYLVVRPAQSSSGLAGKSSSFTANQARTITIKINQGSGGPVCFGVS